MTKTNAKCLEIAIKTGNKLLAVRLALLACVEGGDQVYLPNAQAKVSSVVTAREFSGYLSALQKEGFYRSQGDGFFGEIVRQQKEID